MCPPANAALLATLQHRDLVAALYRAAYRVGVRITTGARVKTVVPPAGGTSSPRASITLAAGRRFAAHVVTGADGGHSSIRQQIAHTHAGRAQPVPRDISSYQGIVSRRFLQRDPELNRADVLHGTPIWCGSDRGLLGVSRSLHPGAERDAWRAILVRTVRDGVPPAEQWEHISQVWAYNGIGAADEWWIKWGVLRGHALFANAS
jgi:2-polyprenyl-6-methoxyphenol hydroxylase-like FAD-dependent oxidoreductase